MLPCILYLIHFGDLIRLSCRKNIYFFNNNINMFIILIILFHETADVSNVVLTEMHFFMGFFYVLLKGQIKRKIKKFLSIIS